MARYISRRPSPRAWDDFGMFHDTSGIQPVGNPMVYDRGPVDTGILDRDGNAIARMPDEIGFYAKDRERS